MKTRLTAGLDLLGLRLDSHDHRSPGDTGLIHGGLRVRIVQEGLRLVRFIPFKDQSDVIGILHIAIKLIDACRPSRLAIGLIGIEASALLVVISNIEAEIVVDHGSLSFPYYGKE